MPRPQFLKTALASTMLMAGVSLAALPAHGDNHLRDTDQITTSDGKQMRSGYGSAMKAPAAGASGDMATVPGDVARSAANPSRSGAPTGTSGGNGAAGGSDNPAVAATPPSIAIDMESFAQDLYERGYRQGYVRGLVDARNRMARTRAERERTRMIEQSQNSGGDGLPGVMASPAKPNVQYRTVPDMPNRATYEQAEEGKAQFQRDGARKAMPGQSDRDSTGMEGQQGTLILLPPGVTPRMLQRFLNSLNRGG